MRTWQNLSLNLGHLVSVPPVFLTSSSCHLLAGPQEFLFVKFLLCFSKWMSSRETTLWVQLWLIVKWPVGSIKQDGNPCGLSEECLSRLSCNFKHQCSLVFLCVSFTFRAPSLTRSHQAPGGSLGCEPQKTVKLDAAFEAYSHRPDVEFKFRVG